VPYRNGTFLSHAASLALEIEADMIYAGMHAEDAHNWAYPDCTPEFIGAMQNAIYIGTYYKVRLVAPFTYKSKADIVELGIKLGAPLHLTWSCYEGGAVACGICPTCIGRLEAFRSLGQTDPIEYEFDKWRQSNHQRQIANASVQLNAALAQSERERHGTE
jgi:7-cyano-7-deazaguanine synthase